MEKWIGEYNGIPKYEFSMEVARFQHSNWNNVVRCRLWILSQMYGKWTKVTSWACRRINFMKRDEGILDFQGWVGPVTFLTRIHRLINELLRPSLRAEQLRIVFMSIKKHIFLIEYLESRILNTCLLNKFISMLFEIILHHVWILTFFPYQTIELKDFSYVIIESLKRTDATLYLCIIIYLNSWVGPLLNTSRFASKGIQLAIFLKLD